MAKTWKTRGILAVSLALIVAAALAVRDGTGRAGAYGGTSGGSEVVDQGKRPVVEVVFALDTTGSMTGLIEGAKAKIWAIANHIASGQPTPEVRIGLIAYRDHGDAYVTQVTDLTGDLDAVYAQLMALQAEGGGDTPEDVNQALDRAIHDMHWQSGSMKLIFLVGDAPPHTDYPQPSYAALAREAASKQIVINAIRCGNVADTGAIFADIAQLSGGKFTSIEQDGGVVAVATPVDGRLAELNAKLNETNFIYGDSGVQLRFRTKASTSVAAPAATAADRSSWYAHTGKKMDDADILDDLAEGRREIGGLDKNLLPEPMRGMSDEEQKVKVQAMAHEKEALKKEINQLSKERDAYLKTAKPKGGGGFDSVVEGTISEQGEKYGIAY